MSRPVSLVAPALALALCACGYGAASPGARVIAVRALEERGIDVDAGAEVLGAVRRAIARGPALRLAGAPDADAELALELVGTTTELEAFADPAARAAEYRAVIHVRGTLYSADGSTLWRSAVITGEAPFLSTPGPIERLDGARRLALQRAARDAAERLVAALTWRAKP